MTDKLVGRGGFIGVGAYAPVPAEQPNFAGLNNETDYTCLVDCGNGYYVRVFAFKRQNRFTFSLLSTTKTPEGKLRSYQLHSGGVFEEHEVGRELKLFADKKADPNAHIDFFGESPVTIPFHGFETAFKVLRDEFFGNLVHFPGLKPK